MELLKTKTFWTGVAAVATAAGSYVGAETSIGEALQIAFTGLAAIFLRDGLLKQSGE